MTRRFSDPVITLLMPPLFARRPGDDDASTRYAATPPKVRERPRDPDGGEDGAGVDDDALEDDGLTHVPHDGGAEDDALGLPGDADVDLDGEDSSNHGTDDAGSDHLDIGLHDVFDEGQKGADDAAGIAQDAGDEFVPTFDDFHGGGSDDPIEDTTEHDDDALPATADDGGAEGIGDGSESEVDEAALPAMDADAGGDFELTDLLEEMGFGGEEPWETVPQLGRDVALACVRCREGMIAAAGSAAALLLDKGTLAPRVRRLTEGAFDCALSEEALVLATRRGIELLDVSLSSAPRVIVERADIADVAVAAGQIWARAGSQLLRVDALTGHTEVVREDVTGVAAAQGTLFVTTAAKRGSLERLRGHDGAFEKIDVDGATREALGRGATIAACTPSVLVLVQEGSAQIVSVTGASTRLPCEGVVAATFRGLGGGAKPLVLARTERGMELMTFDAKGTPSSIATLEEAPGEWRVTWDASREIAVVVGPKGLIGLRPRLKH